MRGYVGLVAVGTLLTLPCQLHAVIIAARSVALADVSSAVASASDGDAVVVPAGSASWTSPLTITKAITLRGAGENATVILDDIAGANRHGQPRAAQSHRLGPGQLPRQTRWSNFPKTGPLAGRGNSGRLGNSAIIRIEISTSNPLRISGFTLRYGSGSSASDVAIALSGTCPAIRVDHCHFDQLYTGHNIQISGWLYGVIDHCVFDIRSGNGRGTAATALVSHPSWGNQPSGWGSWADPPYFGSEKFIFLEDNVINNLGKAPNGGTIDADRGGRYVARYNTLNNLNIFYHGSDTGAGGMYLRGARAVEIYNNTFHSTHPLHPAGQCRGGSLLWHDNKYMGTFKNGMALRVYRLFQGGPVRMGKWGAANGTSPWDCNATEKDGTHIDGHAPYTFASGTHTGANDSTVVTVSGDPWQPNQWVGYSVTNTNSASPYFNGAAYIIGNTANTLTMLPGNDRPFPRFNTGDTFAIHKVLIVLDQPGRGKGDLIRGTPTNAVAAWPHQELEPCYSWNNTLNGDNVDFAPATTKSLLREGVDYYNNTPMPGYKPFPYPHPLTKADAKPGGFTKGN